MFKAEYRLLDDSQRKELDEIAAKGESICFAQEQMMRLDKVIQFYYSFSVASANRRRNCIKDHLYRIR
jgi:hypothetical protein